MTHQSPVSPEPLQTAPTGPAKDAPSDGDPDFPILKEIYTHVHKEMTDFRSVAFRMATVYLTFISAFVGWWATNPEKLSNQAWLIWVGLLGTIFMLVYLVALEIFFLDTAKVINKIERLWGAFEADRFRKSEPLQKLWAIHKKRETILLPKRWEDFGTWRWGEPVFRYTQFLLVLMIVVFGWLFYSYFDHTVVPLLKWWRS